MTVKEPKVSRELGEHQDSKGIGILIRIEHIDRPVTHMLAARCLSVSKIKKEKPNKEHPYRISARCNMNAFTGCNEKFLRILAFSTKEEMERVHELLVTAREEAKNDKFN